LFLIACLLLVIAHLAQVVGDQSDQDESLLARTFTTTLN
jgi:hypothetical protein